MVDLHIHSQYSDGTYPVEYIIQSASQIGINHISITDHNRIDAYLKHDIASMQEQYNIKITTGVEIDCKACGEYAHILGYGFDANNKNLNQLLNEIIANSYKLDCETIKLMETDYDNLSVEEFLDYSFDRTNGGWFFINYLKEKGLTNNLLDGTKFYSKYPVDFQRIQHDLKEVCDIVHSAGGIVVYAHPPFILGNDIKFVLNNMRKSIDTGLDGIECYHPIIDDNMSAALIKLCDQHSLYITSGGDSHGKFLDESKYYIGGQNHGKIRFI